MTKRERAQLRKAIHFLKQDARGECDDGWEQGMRLLLPLAGLRSAAYDAIDKSQTISLKDVARGENRPFGLNKAEGGTDAT